MLVHAWLQYLYHRRNVCHFVQCNGFHNEDFAQAYTFRGGLLYFFGGPNRGLGMVCTFLWGGGGESWGGGVVLINAQSIIWVTLYNNSL